jgi:uncharacterized membrane protein
LLLIDEPEIKHSDTEEKRTTCRSCAQVDAIGVRQSMPRIVDLISRQDARHRLVIALAAAAAIFFSLRGVARLSTAVIATWDAFAFFVLALAWLTILATPQHKLRNRAQQQDVGRTAIFIFVVVVACAALFAVGFLVSVNKGAMHGHFTVHLILSLMTVVFSWSLMHTVFGLRYAHAFYGDSDEFGQERHAGGLEFPGERSPDYFDFAYFSFVVGMTCQVSDVQITSRRMRRLTLLHSVLCFGFNTVILALLINTVSSLL